MSDGYDWVDDPDLDLEQALARFDEAVAGGVLTVLVVGDERHRRELAEQHRDDIVEDSAVPVVPKRLGQTVSVRLDPDLAESLYDYAARLGWSLSDVLRHAARFMLGNQEDPVDETERERAAHYDAQRDDPGEWGDDVRKGPSRRLASMVSVRLTPDEAAAVRRAAERMGMSLSAFLRSAGLARANSLTGDSWTMAGGSAVLTMVSGLPKTAA